MQDILDLVTSWRADGVRCVLAAVVTTTSSAPLPVGSLMAISEGGRVHGSVSGGCVEAAVIEEAQAVLADGRPRLRRYGVSDADALAVGLTCGGTIEVLITALEDGQPGLAAVRAAVAARRPVAIAFPLPGGADEQRDLGSPVLVELAADRTSVIAPGLGADLPDHAVELLLRGRCSIVELATAPGSAPDRIYLQVFAPHPRLLVFGVSSFAVATARLGRFLGYHVTVCDPRAALLTRERFPDPDELVVEWPHRYLDSSEVDPETVLFVLTHDAKYDLPLLERALASDAAYVGAIGSRRTDEERRRRLVERGVPADQLARLRSPIGLDLGGRTAQEVAVAIFAEVALLREGRAGQPLTDTVGPLHGELVVEV